jgi:TldD protein
MKKFSVNIILFFIILFAVNNAFSQDNLLTALQTELNRSIQALSSKGIEKPYFMSYSVSDLRTIDVQASFGGIIFSKDNRSRNGSIDIRIGDYNFDNSNFAGTGAYNFQNRLMLPIEDDIYSIKYELWTATDKAYKTVIDEMSRKKAAMQNKTYSENVDDFSKETPEKYLADKSDFAIDKNKLEDLTLECSKVFKNYPEITKSDVSVNFIKGNKYFLNTEGTVIRSDVSLLEFFVTATAVDKKGNRFSDFIAFYVKKESDLPSTKVIEDSINNLSKKIIALLNSPYEEDYIGPVLVENSASGNFLCQVLSKSLSGKPAPFSASSAILYPASQLIRKIGKKILPDFLSMYDDPCAENYKGQPLIGYYKYDDEGVKAKKVEIVKNGILNELLVSRKPNNKIKSSNGHGRNQTSQKADARPANVFVTSSQNKKYSDLKNELIKLCKEQGLEYGIMVKKISDVAIFSEYIESFSSSLPAARSNEISVSLPITAYKVYVKDGREELVRGLSFSNINLKSLNDIVSTSNDYHVYNLELKGNSGLLPTSFTAPSILFEEFELASEKDQNKKPPVLKNPYFTGK